MTPQTDRLRWRKSSHSGGTNINCIELAHTLNAMRDSKNPHGPTLTADLSSMMAAIKAGHLDR
jgi:hypothetical protein